MELQKQEQSNQATCRDIGALQETLRDELNFTNGIPSEVVCPILDHVVVCEESTDKKIDLEIYLRIGKERFAEVKRDPFVFSISSSRSVNPKGKPIWLSKSEEFTFNKRKIAICSDVKLMVAI